jgi:hypothetical protein
MATPGGTTPYQVPEGTSGAAPDSTGGGMSLGAGSPPETNFDVGALGGPGGSAVGGNSFAAGSAYVESAIPLTQYRLRYDAADGDNRPDRADFFYPKCGCFRFVPPALGGDPRAPGPGTGIASRVNYQELSNYVEVAPIPQFSVFADIPVRWVDIFFTDPTLKNETHQGLSDIDFGFKYAMVYEPTQVFTFQFRTYSPTGASQQGLGRNNWNLEPALLYYRQLAPRLFLDAELRDFIPVASQDDFAGNVLRYGVSLSSLVYDRTTFRVTVPLEFVAWNVLTGKESTPTGVKDAAGDTIVNVKIGVRFGFGETLGISYLNRADFYVGYGRALTGDVWYKDLARAELRIRF